MASSLIGTLVMVLAGLFGFLLLILVCVFVGFGALKLLKNKKQLAKVDITDGIDAEEMAILQGVFASKKKAEKEIEVRTKAVEALKL
jgi:uncharacterized membrane protein